MDGQDTQCNCLLPNHSANYVGFFFFLTLEYFNLHSDIDSCKL